VARLLLIMCPDIGIQVSVWTLQDLNDTMSLTNENV
jgi:hypothetical protein